MKTIATALTPRGSDMRHCSYETSHPRQRFLLQKNRYEEDVSLFQHLCIFRKWTSISLYTTLYSGSKCSWDMHQTHLTTTKKNDDIILGEKKIKRYYRFGHTPPHNLISSCFYHPTAMQQCTMQYLIDDIPIPLYFIKAINITRFNWWWLMVSFTQSHKLICKSPATRT